MILIKKNESTTTLRRVPVIIVDQSDGNTLETGQTNFNIEVSKAGAAQASGTGVWGEIGDGEYYYQFGTTEVNTFGFLIARFNKTGMREFKAVAQIVGFNPYQTISTQSSLNALNNISTTQVQSIVNAQGLEVQSLINALNDVSTSEVQSIVNAQGLEVQSLINALNDLSVSQVQSIINNHQTDINTKIDALNDLSQTQVNAQVDTALSDIRLDELISQSTANIDAVKNAFLDLIMNKGVSQLFSQATDSLEAIRDNQSAGGGATPTSIWNFGTRVLTANTNLNDPTSSAINAVITTAHGAGSYVGAGASQTIINEHNATQSLINALNNITSSAVNAVITTAHGAGSYVGAGASQTIINEHNATQSMINALNDLSTSQVQSIVNAEGNEVQSLINTLNDLSTAQVQSIVNAQGLEVQSLINALNDLSTSEVQSIVNAQGLETQSLINAMDVKIIRIEGRGGQYLVGKYTYNTSDINTKIEYWQYGSQTDMNNHQTINNVNKWQLDVTLAGQLANIIKAGDHA
jgi:arsenate reductase-like glutaredoxin family protein